MGANNAGNAVGPVANLNIFPPKVLLLIGGVSIAVGAFTYGRKVADTVGKGITPLDIPSAFVAQISSAFGMHLFSMLGIPAPIYRCCGKIFISSPKASTKLPMPAKLAVIFF